MNKGTLYFNQMIQWSVIDGKQSYSIPFTLTDVGMHTFSGEIETSIKSVLIQKRLSSSLCGICTKSCRGNITINGNHERHTIFQQDYTVAIIW